MHQQGFVDINNQLTRASISVSTLLTPTCWGGPWTKAKTEIIDLFLGLPDPLRENLVSRIAWLWILHQAPWQLTVISLGGTSCLVKAPQRVFPG